MIEIFKEVARRDPEGAAREIWELLVAEARKDEEIARLREEVKGLKERMRRQGA